MTTDSGSIPLSDLHVAVPSRKSTTFSRACLKQGPRESESDDGRSGGCHHPPQQLVMGRCKDKWILPRITTLAYNKYASFSVSTVREKKHKWDAWVNNTMKLNRRTGLHWTEDRKRRQEIGEKVRQRWRKNSWTWTSRAATHSPPRLNRIKLWHWIMQKSSSQESTDRSIDQRQPLSELSRSVHCCGKMKPQGGKKVRSAIWKCSHQPQRLFKVEVEKKTSLCKTLWNYVLLN